MTHTISSNTNLVPVDITRTHTQMRKSRRGEKESGKEMRRGREIEKRKNGRKENLNKKERKKNKKEINKLIKN